MRSTRHILAILILTIIAVPIANAASGPLINQPIVLQPECSDTVDPSLLLGAAWKTMETLGWEVLKAQSDHFLAQACQDGPRSFCVQVDVFLVNGVIEVWEHPFMPPVREKSRRKARGWVENVQAAYGQVQCGAEEELEAAFELLQGEASPQWIMDEALKTQYKQEGKYGRWLDWSDRAVDESSDSAQ